MRFDPPFVVTAGVLFADAALPAGWDDLLDTADYPSPPAAAIPHPAQSLVQALGRTVRETLTGQRSPQQLAQWLSADQCEQIAEWSRRARGVPVRHTRTRLELVQVSRIEGFQIFERGEQAISSTLSIRQVAGHWRCAQLAILLPGTSWRSDGGPRQS